ncbi:hypothetical protein GGX14DRAFT_567587 [Mycena pura]|uniref:Uncharacterized protein n=1 Tax=Mycena pura TaxID=153505 RepID=A0AAD6VET2_9AGAR|nr:hypothetical protein GGX14DRAFT_567587 [Mycena pura]
MHYTKDIHVYPEIPEDGVIREIWHALKWRKGLDLDVLSPMYDAGTTHYYVNELARAKDGKLVIPIRWLIFRGDVYADAFTVTIDEVPSLSSPFEKYVASVLRDEMARENEVNVEMPSEDRLQRKMNESARWARGAWAASRLVGCCMLRRRRSCPDLAVWLSLPAAGDEIPTRGPPLLLPLWWPSRGVVALAGMGAASVLSIRRQHGVVRRGGFCGRFRHHASCVVLRGFSVELASRGRSSHASSRRLSEYRLATLASSPCTCAGPEESVRRCCCSAASLPPARDEALPRPPLSPMPVVFVCYAVCGVHRAPCAFALGVLYDFARPSWSWRLCLGEPLVGMGALGRGHGACAVVASVWCVDGPSCVVRRAGRTSCIALFASCSALPCCAHRAAVVGRRAATSLPCPFSLPLASCLAPLLFSTYTAMRPSSVSAFAPLRQLSAAPAHDCPWLRSYRPGILLALVSTVNGKGREVLKTVPALSCGAWIVELEYRGSILPSS